MSVRRAQREIDAKEFAYWQAFNRIEPFGDDWRKIGILGQAIAGTVGVKTKPEHFMPPMRKPRQSVEEQRMIMELFAASLTAQATGKA